MEDDTSLKVHDINLLFHGSSLVHGPVRMTMAVAKFVVRARGGGTPGGLVSPCSNGNLGTTTSNMLALAPLYKARTKVVN